MDLVDWKVVKMQTCEEMSKAADEAAWYLNPSVVERLDKHTMKLRCVEISRSVFDQRFGKGSKLHKFTFSLFLKIEDIQSCSVQKYGKNV